MLGLRTIPFINKDSGKLVYLKYKNAYFEAKQVLNLNPLRFSQNTKPIATIPELTTSLVGLKRQLVFTEQGAYSGRLGGWQFDQQGLFLANIIVVDTSFWRKLIGKLRPDFVVARSQIRKLTNRKIIIDSEAQIVEQDQASYLIAQ